MGSRQRLYGTAIFSLGMAALGVAVSNPYEQQLLTIIGIHTLLALGLNMLMGYAGQISLGHAAFFGLGAYGTGILTTHFQWSPWASLPAVLVFAALSGYLIGRPILRLSGYYLAMGTLGLGIIVHVLFREWDTFTGGASGLVGIPPLSVGRLIVGLGRSGFFAVWATVVLFFVLCGRVVDSRIGRALRALGDSQGAAAASGIHTAHLKAAIFSFSAVMAALAGYLYAHLLGFISPSSFDFLMSIRMVTMVVIGGMASIWGSLLGASVITLLPEWLHVFSDYEMMVYGLILMGVMIFLPQGLTRGVLDALQRARARTASS
ncbi:MAG: branched-chain amino acid ABC transporter permease [Desulfosoma sp.]